jgi:hypothetical protein
VQTTTVSVQIPALIPPTTFTIEVSMLDFLRNGFFLDSDGLEARGFPSTVEVINTVLDETPPELLDFTLSSGVYNLTAEGGSAISSSFFANLTVRDDQSGISTVTLLATGDNGGQFQEFLYSYTQPPLVGTFKFSNDYWFTLSWYEPQDYKLAVILEDAKNNVRSLQSNDLIARGLPGGFKVVV